MILAYFAMFSPLLSTVALVASADRKYILGSGHYSIALGAGMAATYVLVGSITAFLGLHAPLFLPPFFMMISLAGFAGIAGIFYLAISKPSALKTPALIWPWVAVLLFIMAAYFGWSSVPAQSWDGLDLWLREGGRFVVSQTKASTSQPYFFDQRHPFTVAALAAWSVWPASSQQTISLTLLLWSIASLSMALICYGYARYWQIDTRIAVLVALAVLMTPLIENHYLLFGYADIWFAAILVAAIAVCGIGFSSQKRAVILLGFLHLLALAAIKNTGSVFALTLFLVIGLMFVLPKFPFRLLLAVGVVLFSLVILSVERGSPEIKSVFDVRLDGSELKVSSKRCLPAAFDDKFLVSVVPQNPEDLKPLVTKWVADKYPGLDFRVFKKQFSSVSSPDGTCEFNIELGAYDKKLIRIGQLSNTNHPNWMGILIPGATRYSIPAINISMQVGESVLISAIGRYMILELRSPADVGKNFLHAHFLNSSYTLWTLLLLLSTTWYYFERKLARAQDAFPLFSVWALICMLLSSQIFVLDFFTTSLPTNDTRYSRFMLWLPAVTALVAAPLFTHAVTGRRAS